MADFYFDSSPFTDYGEFNPTPLTTSTHGGHTVKQLNPSQSVRFASTSTAISINSYYSTAAGRTYVLLQDGVEVGDVAIPSTGSGAFDDFELATGLSGLHEYEILCITPMDGSSGNWYDSHLVLDADSLAAVAHEARFVWGVYGDSIALPSVAGHETDINSPLITDARKGDTWLACQENGQAMIITASGGGKVVNTGRDNTNGIPVNVDGVAVRYGINDAEDFPGGSATFQEAYADMIDNIRARIGAGKPIVCFRPLGTVTPTAQEDIGTEIQAAISGKANVSYVDTDGWISEDTDHMPDGLHPNAAGYAEMASFLAAALLAATETPTVLNVTTLNIGTLTIG
jgi:hypothetical protein